MPTTSQWRILQGMLKAGRLEQPKSGPEGNNDEIENNDNRTAVSKQAPAPQRRNSFHFSKNERGILTIICRPKSVPFSFAIEQKRDFDSNGIVQPSSNEATVNSKAKSCHDIIENNEEGDSQVYDLDNGVVSKSNVRPLSVTSDISHCESNIDETFPATYSSQLSQLVPVNNEETQRFWDGVSEFPELLDPNEMKTKDGNNIFYQRNTSTSALKRWRLLNSNPVNSKVNKTVTFSRPSSNITDKNRDTDDENVFDSVNDDDNLGINLDNVEKILPKFNNPLGVYGLNRKQSFSGFTSSQSKPSKNARILRPLKSAPALRRLSTAVSVFSSKNKNKNTTINITKQQRSKSSLGSHTETSTSVIDEGISNDSNDAFINNRSYSGGFKIRHTTFAYKEFPWTADRPKSSQYSRPRVTSADIKPHSAKEGESDSFEPYVIQNCRLVRRASQSNGMFSASNNINNSNSSSHVRKGSAKFSFLGKDEATTLSRICDAFIIRGGSGMSRREQLDSTRSSAKGLQRPLSGPCPSRAVSRWSMATQSIITRSIGSLAAINSASPRASGFEESRLTVADAEEIELPEEVQENLHKLGFRKTKGKKKKSEKSAKSKKSQPKKQTVNDDKFNSVIDLKKDPVLVKVQKKNRNVGTFTHEPEPQPCAVCFEIKGSSPSHADVLAEMKKLQKSHPEVEITKLKFDYRALVNNSPDMDNRWIITTNSVASRNRIAGSHIRLAGQDAQLRRYDDVITTEYQQYRRMMDFVKMMNSRLGMKEK